MKVVADPEIYAFFEGNELSKLLSEKGITPEELAKRIRFDPGYVKNIVNGVYGVSRFQAMFICSALGVSLEDLFPNVF